MPREDEGQNVGTFAHIHSTWHSTHHQNAPITKKEYVGDRHKNQHTSLEKACCWDLSNFSPVLTFRSLPTLQVDHFAILFVSIF